MDLAVSLVKAVMRAFYSTRDILVIDALILHEALRDDDLAYLMAITTKDLHKICGKLREDRFLTVHTRSELREGNPRPSNRTWYYINYRHAVDAVKWRVFTIDKEVQGSGRPVNEKKEYFCSFCRAEWTTMELLDSVGAEGFLCHRCGHVLTYEAERNSGGHEQSTRLNDQFKFISELLPRIDAVFIPECDFDRAFSKARPVVRDATHQRAATSAVEPGTNRPMAVRGLTNLEPQSLAVNISTSEGLSSAEIEAERARRERIARQNALPSWMSNSTVTGESFSGSGAALGVPAAIEESHAMPSAQAMPMDNNSSAQIDDIFERLKAEQAAQLAWAENLDSEEDGEEEDEDGDDFEDVTAGNENSKEAEGGILGAKRAASTTSSNPETGHSPTLNGAKRIKAEHDSSTGASAGAAVAADDPEDGEDELEFEDI